MFAHLDTITNPVKAATMSSNLETWRQQAGLSYADVAARIGAGCSAADAEAFALGRRLPDEAQLAGIRALMQQPLYYGLETWRQARGLSQGEAAEMIGDGCTAQRISRYEQGEEMPSAARQERIQHVTGGLVGMYEMHRFYVERQRAKGHPKYQDLPEAPVGGGVGISRVQSARA